MFQLGNSPVLCKRSAGECPAAAPHGRLDYACQAPIALPLQEVTPSHFTKYTRHYSPTVPHIHSTIPQLSMVTDGAQSSLEELVVAITSYYEFLISFYLPASSLKFAPMGGWPDIHPSFFDPPKSDTIMEILRNIPYIDARERHDNPFQLYEGCEGMDYTGHEFLGNGPHDAERDPLTDDAEDIGVDISAHTIVLAAAPTRDGWHFILQTEETDWMIELWDFQCDICERYPVKAFFEKLKERFRTLEVYPIDPEQVVMANGCPAAANAEYTTMFHAFGWPTAEYRKKECMREIKKAWNENMGFSDTDDENENEAVEKEVREGKEEMEF
ncbi:hypothetical protein BU16DRAFT_534825 [Lophium mytilinum]|uniref:Uncharacterized protein n=1 Tax=Lophium mytilinum TaxID=390894 RepID=A0A6A6R9R7_9PEZI|nr:hypothetical protein BU16DRAFT_534825 [Lophium mytilinum]